MPSDDLAFMPATDMAGAIRSRKLSPVEVTRAILERMEPQQERDGPGPRYA